MTAIPGKTRQILNVSNYALKGLSDHTVSHEVKVYRLMRLRKTEDEPSSIKLTPLPQDVNILSQR